MKKMMSFLLGSSLILSLSACTGAQKLLNNVGGDLVSGVVGDAIGDAVDKVTSAYPSHVSAIAIQENKTVSVSGDIADGIEVKDLGFAERSSVACFPGTQNEKFRAKHRFYSFKIDGRSIATIKLIPEDLSEAMSLYAYQVATTNYTLPPELGSVTSCEADHIYERPRKGHTEDGTRTVKLNSVGNPYNVVVAVTGKAGITGKFKLEVTYEK